nr:hypothetical protein CFP56_71344 [Quercus suber]
MRIKAFDARQEKRVNDDDRNDGTGCYGDSSSKVLHFIVCWQQLLVRLFFRCASLFPGLLPEQRKPCSLQASLDDAAHCHVRVLHIDRGQGFYDIS